MKNIFIIFSRLIWYMQVPLRTATVKNESKVWILFHALCISCSLYFMLFIFHALWSEEYFWDQWIVQTQVVMIIITIIMIIIVEIHLKRLLIMYARASSYWRHTLCNLLVIANLLIWYCCTFSNVLSFGSFIIIVERRSKRPNNNPTTIKGSRLFKSTKSPDIFCDTNCVHGVSRGNDICTHYMLGVTFLAASKKRHQKYGISSLSLYWCYVKLDVKYPHCLIFQYLLQSHQGSWRWVCAAHPEYSNMLLLSWIAFFCQVKW